MSALVIEIDPDRAEDVQFVRELLHQQASDLCSEAELDSALGLTLKTLLAIRTVGIDPEFVRRVVFTKWRHDRFPVCRAIKVAVMMGMIAADGSWVSCSLAGGIPLILEAMAITGKIRRRMTEEGPVYEKHDAPAIGYQKPRYAILSRSLEASNAR